MDNFLTDKQKIEEAKIVFLPTLVKNNSEYGANENILRTESKNQLLLRNHKAIIECF